jgi:hypothetical protein
VKIKVRERIANIQKTSKRKTRRWDVQKLQKDTAQRDDYQKALDLKTKQNKKKKKECVCVCTKEMGTFGTGNKSCGRGNQRGNKI